MELRYGYRPNLIITLPFYSLIVTRAQSGARGSVVG
jgi:hypothetical protein